MDLMLPNAFIGKTAAPSGAELAVELGPPLRALWDELLDTLERDHALITREWNSYSPKAGWSLRVKQKKRNILYLIPCHEAFAVAFVFGDKAITAIREAQFPKKILTLIDSATHYPEGTGIRLEITSARDLTLVSKLTAIKLAH